MGKLKEAGIRPLVVLSFANKLYDGGMTPYSPEGCDGYARYAAEVLKHYGGQIRWLEVWNEYNGSFLRGQGGRGPAAVLYGDGQDGLREDQGGPAGRYGAWCPVLIPLPYFEAIFKQRGLDAMDAVVIHPYRGRPEGVEREIDELDALMKRYNHGEAKPVWCTEYGYGLHNAGTLANVAKNLVRQSVLLRSRNVRRMFWYLFSDYASFKSMGLVQLPGSPNGRHAPNPAGPAFANMVWLLHDARYEAREAAEPFTKCHVHKFTKPGGGGDPRLLGDVSGDDRRRGRRPARPVRSDGQRDAAGTSRRPDRDPAGRHAAVSAGAGETRFRAAGGGNDHCRLGRGVLGRPGREPLVLRLFRRDRPTALQRRRLPADAQVETVWGVNWSAESGKIPFLALSREGGHPALRKGKPVWAVRRWESPLEGTVRLDGRIAVGDSRSHGVEYVLLVDGKPADKIEVVPSADKRPAEIGGRIEVHRGSKVDFCVNPGPDNDLGYDAFSFEVRMFVRRSTR